MLLGAHPVPRPLFECTHRRVDDPVIANRQHADYGDEYRLCFGLLHRKLAEYNVLPERAYEMDGKGFMIGVAEKRKWIRGAIPLKAVQPVSGPYRYDVKRLASRSPLPVSVAHVRRTCLDNSVLLLAATAPTRHRRAGIASPKSNSPLSLA
ncbi:hypothetical protein OPT61_g3806 [Boeremia exigua]|uniref:Uncharacterized protein n=1 Tax=Boeremia exigua TaxID=749465 RepID=A0ACC2IGF7_9PLEO|nr:hypothetical protein OPT61_g3806 [Boeremia exigua]